MLYDKIGQATFLDFLANYVPRSQIADQTSPMTPQIAIHIKEDKMCIKVLLSSAAYRRSSTTAKREESRPASSFGRPQSHEEADLDRLRCDTRRMHGCWCYIECS